MRLLLGFFVLIHYIIGLAVSQGGFVNSCKDLKLPRDSTVLHANCRRKSGEYVENWLELNNCIGNNNGDLMCRLRAFLHELFS
ncbi:hypothetical protein N7481_007762 [Penicillium waksmanii]|uniref:uncharacterized protein n=1 Tax=Penicillium waksmanii TaxID=69791 RepID=UPI00254842E9|nr:uncharacterized protein N7481_007762 [Penicillium waksmanii]KAJ5980464.1 hypothetical protein N7481_007762 [Penicillium waksmanii]